MHQITKYRHKLSRIDIENLYRNQNVNARNESSQKDINSENICEQKLKIEHKRLVIEKPFQR